jgi:hypothetical protein
VWHVSVFRNDLEAFDCLCVADNIVEVDWAIFLDPVQKSIAWRFNGGMLSITMAARSWRLQLH